MSIRKPEQQVEHMAEDNVRAGYNSRRPMEYIELEEADKKRSPK